MCDFGFAVSVKTLALGKCMAELTKYFYILKEAPAIFELFLKQACW